jgi:hypothetical protein
MFPQSIGSISSPAAVKSLEAMFLQSLSTAGTNKPDDFPAFAEKYLRIQNKRMQTVPLRLNSIQRRFLRERTGRDVVLKSRQVGISTVEQARMFWKARTGTVATMTLGKDEENKTRLRLMWQEFQKNLPKDTMPKPKYDNGGLIVHTDTGSYQVMNVAGAKGAGRSFSFTDVHLSEVAFFTTDPVALLTGIQNSGEPESILLESTPNGESGFFYELCMELLQDPDQSPWKLHFFPWFEMDEYELPLEPGEVIEPDEEEAELIEKHGLNLRKIKWRRFKIAEALGGKADFLQEYPEDPITCFKTSGESFFGNVDYAYVSPPDIETEPIPGDVYVAGLDFGQDPDPTALRIRNRRTGCSVAGLRVRQEDWSVMRKQALDLCKFWGVKLMWAESNSAGSNIEDMRKEKYSGLRIKAVAMTFPLKRDLSNSFRAAVWEKRCKIFDTPTVRAEIKSAKRKPTEYGWTMEIPRRTAKDGEEHSHGDDVIAEMLSWEASHDYVAFDTTREAAHL